MPKKTIIEEVGAALAKKYDISIVSCTDSDGEEYTYIKRKGGEQENLNAIFKVTANIVSIALNVALNNGITEAKFWQVTKAYADNMGITKEEFGKRTKAYVGDNGLNPPGGKEEKNESYSKVVPLPKNQMSRKITIDEAGEALLKTYVSCLISCEDNDGKIETYYNGKTKETMNPEVFLQSAAHIVSIALYEALNYGCTEGKFWLEMQKLANATDPEEQEPKQEKDEPHGVVFQFPQKAD